MFKKLKAKRYSDGERAGMVCGLTGIFPPNFPLFFYSYFSKGFDEGVKKGISKRYQKPGVSFDLATGRITFNKAI